MPRRLLAIEAGALLLAIVLALPTADAIPPALFGVPVLVYGWLGARIAERAPRNPVGWLLSTASLTAAVALLLVSYGRVGALHGTGAPPLREPLTLVNAVVPLPVIGASLLLAFMLFPTGSLPSRRWRAGPVIVVLTGIIVLVISLLHELDAVRGEVTATLDVVIVVSLGLSAFATVATLIVRARGGSAEERAPIRGLLFTLLGMAAAFALFAFRITQVEWDLWIVLSFLVIMLGTLAGIPLTLSVAMLRYGLFDYEVGIRKRIAAWLLAGLIVVGASLVLFLVAETVGGLVSRDGRGDPSEAAVIGLVTGVVAGIALAVIVRLARRFAERVVFHDRATPYEVLSEFTERVGETYSLDDVLPRMTQLLARGTGASAASAWVEVDGRLRAVSRFPEGAALPALMDSGDDVRSHDPSTHAYPVRRAGRLLGALSVTMPTNDPMNEAKERLARELAAQAGLVLQNVALLEDVRESRRRIVAAQDERARALERNIHDGAQQQLVALTVKLRLAEQLAERDPAATAATLRTLQDDATAALEDLRDLARGIYPPLLADQGLGAALEAQARKAALPVEVEADGVGRHRRDVESVVYFSCLEALNNTAKYAGASRAVVRLALQDGMLRFEVTDDGCGFDVEAVARGTGLQGIEDRVEAIGGTLEIRSASGEGTRLLAMVPASPAASDVAAAMSDVASDHPPTAAAATPDTS